MLGELLGTPQPQENPEVKGKWDSWLQNPANRAGLLSFGLQALAGGWGDTGQQLAQAIGAGAEAYSGTTRLLNDQALEERQRSDKLGEAEAERSLRRELNTADNEAAMARTKYSTDNRVGGGASSLSNREAMFADAVFKKQVGVLQAKNKQIMDRAAAFGDDPVGVLTDEEIIEQATEFANDAVMRRRERLGAGGKTSEISPPAGEPEGSPGPVETPALEAPSDASDEMANDAEAPDPAKPKPKDILPLLSDPETKKMWESPGGRKALEALGYREFLRPSGKKGTSFGDYLKERMGR